MNMACPRKSARCAMSSSLLISKPRAIGARSTIGPTPSALSVTRKRKPSLPPSTKPSMARHRRSARAKVKAEFLATFLQSVAEERIELGDRVDFLRGLLAGVSDAAEFDQIVVQEHVTGPRIAVSRLSDAADVDHQFRVRQRVAAADLVRRQKAAILGEDAGNMRVALKGIAVDQGEQPLKLFRIVRVFGEDVLAQRIAH